jgi:hydroxymethylbilane synthase
LRGNVDTRVRKALDGQYDAIILAGAGLTRLGLEKHVTEWLPLNLMLPAPGQGALAVQCRADDHETLSLLAALEDSSTRKSVTAERAFLSGLGGGCSVPVAAYATVESAAPGLPKDQRPKVINMTGLVISEDGKRAIQVTRTGFDAQLLGNELAQRAIAQGANEILKMEMIS